MFIADEDHPNRDSGSSFPAANRVASPYFAAAGPRRQAQIEPWLP
jgi:hypothetical protein